MTDALTGRFHGPNPTDAERESGIVVETTHRLPLKPGGPGHRVLHVFRSGNRKTSYDASYSASGGDWHRYRREATRLYMRGFLAKDGVMSNLAPGGRKHVDAYVITDAGRAELARLGPLQD